MGEPPALIMKIMFNNSSRSPLRPSARVWDTLLTALVFVSAFALYARTLAPSLTWRNDGADGGDLISAAANFGVAHPPGYPTYMLLARLFLWLPLGDEAFRLNLMSAFFASAALALFYLFCVRLHAPADAQSSRASALAAAALLALSPLVWSQATIAEVYALHLFFVVASLLALQFWQAQPRARHACFVGALLGVGLGNHLTLVLAAPVAIITFARAPRERTRAFAALSIGLVLGLSVYLYLPLASAFGAQLNWGRIDSLGALWAYASGDLYRGYLFALPPDAWSARVSALLLMLVSQFQGWALALALVGLVRQWRRARAWALGLSALALGSVLFALGYRTADSLYYLMPLWLVCAAWFGGGLSAIVQALVAPQRAATRRALYAVLLLMLMLVGLRQLPALDLSADHEAEQVTRQTLAALPPHAVLLSATDRQTFALWYYTQVRRERSDVIVIDRDLLGYAPYRLELQRHAPTLRLDEGAWQAFIAANRVAHAIYLLEADASLRAVEDGASHVAAR